MAEDENNCEELVSFYLEKYPSEINTKPFYINERTGNCSLDEGQIICEEVRVNAAGTIIMKINNTGERIQIITKIDGCATPNFVGSNQYAQQGISTIATSCKENVLKGMTESDFTISYGPNTQKGIIII